MSLTPTSEVRSVSGIAEERQQRILDFLQGAVYCWCKNRPQEWFALRDLVGSENHFWQGTPLMDLYQKHETTSQDPVADAAKDGGWLLKSVIDADARQFETKVANLVRHYRRVNG